LSNARISSTLTGIQIGPPFGQNTRAMGRLADSCEACAGSYHEPCARHVRFHWARLLAFVTGLVNQELLLCSECLAAENRILRARLPSRLRWSDPERSTLAEISKRLGRKALKDIARVAKPDTILGWHRRLVARKFDGSGSVAIPAALASHR
jgi:hypothetical protein